MQKKSTVPNGKLEVPITYTDKPDSGWGGLTTIFRYFNKLGVQEVLQKALPDGRTSPNQTPVLEIVLGFLASILTGGFRFAHIARLRGDKVISAILPDQRGSLCNDVNALFSRICPQPR